MLLAHRRLIHNAWLLVPVTIVVAAGLLALPKAKQSNLRFPVCAKLILFVHDLYDKLQLSVRNTPSELLIPHRTAMSYRKRPLNVSKLSVAAQPTTGGLLPPHSRHSHSRCHRLLRNVKDPNGG